MAAHMAPDHDVLQRSHFGEQADILEGTRDAGLGHLVHRLRSVADAVQGEAAAIG